MTKRFILLALICVFFARNGNAQNYGDVLGNDRPSWVDKIYVGGGLGGFGFSSDRTWVNVSGQVGYRITDKWNAGVGLTYQYFKWKIPPEQSFNDYGLSFYTQYVIYEPFFAMAQYEILFLDTFEGRTNEDRMLIGGGISQPMGGRGFVNLYALYNVLYNQEEDLRYDSPWVIGMNFGIGF